VVGSLQPDDQQGLFLSKCNFEEKTGQFVRETNVQKLSVFVSKHWSIAAFNRVLDSDIGLQDSFFLLSEISETPQTHDLRTTATFYLCNIDANLGIRIHFKFTLPPDIMYLYSCLKFFIVDGPMVCFAVENCFYWASRKTQVVRMIPLNSDIGESANIAEMLWCEILDNNDLLAIMVCNESGNHKNKKCKNKFQAEARVSSFMLNVPNCEQQNDTVPVVTKCFVVFIPDLYAGLLTCAAVSLGKSSKRMSRTCKNNNPENMVPYLCCFNYNLQLMNLLSYLSFKISLDLFLISLSLSALQICNSGTICIIVGLYILYI